MSNGDIGGSRRGRGRGWLQPEDQPRELRQPRNLAPDIGECENMAYEYNNYVIPVEAPKSTLSAEAKEWYPPNYTPQAAPAYPPEVQPYRVHRSSVQDRLRQAQDQNPYNFDDMTFSLEEAENMDLRQNIRHLITVMCEITFDPGKFDALCGPLVDSFASTLQNANYCRPLVKAIVNQSIGEPNFRYNGARLCSMYDSVASAEESCFRACLLERCSTEENKIISGEESSEENVRGFAMFLAEIYTQLEDEGKQERRIKSLGESLCKVLLHLLDTDKEINIKSVCQLLKLSGIALDADCPAGMHAAFERLKSRSAMPIVRTVVALRASRWGMAEPEPVAPPSVPNNDNRRRYIMPEAEGGAGEGSDGGYLADGHALTAEECAFMQSHLPPGKPALDQDILDELENDAWDTGMDAEMQEGFLEFLKISNQIKR